MPKTVVDNGIEFEVIWSGGELLPSRSQRPDSTWTAPKRDTDKSRKYLTLGQYKRKVK